MLLHREAVPFHGSGHRLSAAHGAAVWAGRPIFPGAGAHADRHGYTGACAPASPSPRCSSRCVRLRPPRRRSRPRSRTRSRVPHVSLAATGAVVLDLDTGADDLLAATPRCRSCRHRTRSSPSPTRRSPPSAPPSRSRRTCSARGSRPAATGRAISCSRATAIRRSRARDLRRARASGARERHHARRPAPCSATSRGSTPGGRRSAGRRRSTSTSRRRSRRSSSTAAVYGRVHVARSRARRRTALPSALARAGVHVAGAARHGTADDAAVPIGAVDSPPLSSIVHWMDRVSDNFTPRCS